MRYMPLIDGSSGNYGLVVPDLPGCTSAGKTIQEALHNGRDAVRLWSEDARADGESLPQPRPIETMRRDPDIAEALRHGAVLAIVGDDELVASQGFAGARPADGGNHERA